MTRKAWLAGDQFDLEALARFLPHGDNIIQRDGDEYYLASPDMDAAGNDVQANEIAAKTISRINALGRIHNASFRPVTLSRYTDDTGQTHVFGAMAATLATVRMHAAGTVTYPDGSVPVSPPSPWPDYLALATTNDHVARALDIMSRAEPLGWVELYKVHEIIRRDIEPKKVREMGWTTNGRDRAFTASADRYDVSGDAARHAVDKHAEPPKDTMTINEGHSYVSDLVGKWLDSLK